MQTVELSGGKTANSWDSLLRVGKSLRMLSIALIVVLTVLMELVIVGWMQNNPSLQTWLIPPVMAAVSFGALMLLTISYLIGKERAVARSANQVITEALEEESLNLARRYNPVLDFHHPEVSREMLTQQASLAARLHAPISLIELSVVEMSLNPLSAEWRQVGAELARQVKAGSRQTDTMLRWTPNSYLLVMPEVSSSELEVITTRLHNELEGWFQERFEAHSRPTLKTRGVTTQTLGQDRGQVNDILRETQALLDEQQLRLNPQIQASGTRVRREKSIGLTLPFNISGIDANGEQFSDRVVTQRVAADCIWFVWSREVPVETSLMVTDRDGMMCEAGLLVSYVMKDGERIAEVRFPKVPSNWVM